MAINDGNNFLGMAGSPLTFVVLLDGPFCTALENVMLFAPEFVVCKHPSNGGCMAGRERWRSKPIHQTGNVQSTGQLDMTGAADLRLEVHAEGSNACAHSVWIAPRLFA